MAISKSIPIRAGQSGHVGKAINYVVDESKTSTEIFQNHNRNVDIVGDNIQGAFDYINNPEKTTTGEKSILVSGFRCNPETAALEFNMVADRYHMSKTEHISGEEVYCKGNKKSEGKQKQCRDGYHFIQSFPKGLQIEHEIVHNIGMEFGKRLGNEEFSFVCSTHLNTECLHNHIIMNAYNLDNLSKYRDSKAQLHRMRQINDDLSREYGLPVLLDTENNMSKNYAEIVAVQEGDSWKDAVRSDVENAKLSSSSWSDYKNIMEDSGYRIQENKKSITYISPDGKKVMDKTLGPEHIKEKLQEYWYKGNDGTCDNLSQQIVDEIVVLNQKRIKNYIRSINIKVYRYDIFGRRRSDLELLLIFAIELLVTLTGLLKLLFTNSQQLGKNPTYKSLEWKIKNLSESVVQLRELNIQTRTELDKQINAEKSNKYQLKQEMEKLQIICKNYSSINDSVMVVKLLQAKMDEMRLNKETLCIVRPKETEIRQNKALLEPMTSKQRRNLFLAISDSHNYRLNCKFDEITACQSEEIICFLKSPRNKRVPEVVITIVDFERIRLQKREAVIIKRRYGQKSKNEKTEADPNKHHGFSFLMSKNEKEFLNIEILFTSLLNTELMIPILLKKVLII